MIYIKRKMNKICQYCKKEYMGISFQKFCSDKCRKSHNSDLVYKQNKNGYNNLTSPTKGALNELIVSCDLMLKGYHVFRALSPSCPCDLLIFKNNRMLKIEVTSGWFSGHGDLQRNKKKEESDENDVVATVYSGNKINYFPNII